ncbi:MAG: hypothetical protein JO337_04855 [Acidimicrobiales bacterium]|nr:hypothetical protein [Acidimicrobiales bacterium]
MAWGASPRRQSVVVKSAPERFGAAALARYLDGLGVDGETAKRLDRDVESTLGSVTSLSALTAPLALRYLDRLARPIPSLTPEVGVPIVGRAYVAHMVVERNPGRFEAEDVPVLGTLPPLKRGSPPPDLLVRIVKVSRRSFPALCALTPAGWDGFVHCLTKRAHDLARGADDYVPVDAVDGLARFSWVLRQVDLHYSLEPDRRSVP